MSLLSSTSMEPSDGSRVNSVNTFLLYQLCDSAFPSGSFAHSNGIEALYQCKLIHNNTTLHNYIINITQQNISQTLHIINYTYHNIIDTQYNINYHNLQYITTLLHSTLLGNSVQSRASIVQGNSFLTTSYTLLTPTQQSTVDSIRLYCAQNNLSLHYTISYTIICILLQCNLTECIRMYYWMLVRQCISSAVRLNIVGPNQGQLIQAQISQSNIIDTFIQEYNTIDNSTNNIDPSNPFINTGAVSDTCINSSVATYSTNPILDVMQPLHDRLYARMFNS